VDLPPDGGPASPPTQTPRHDDPPPSAARLAVSVVLTDSRHQFLAVDGEGVAYATEVLGGPALFASVDGARSFATRGVHPLGGEFRTMTVLADGTLLAELWRRGEHFIARSQDHGATWTDVLALGAYRTLTPHSFAELNGTAYLLEYQVFTYEDTPIRLYASSDAGRTWTVRYTFLGHRHGHGLRADPTSGSLWAYFGDTTPQCGILRSTDGGSGWSIVQDGQEGDVVDAVVLPGGDLLFGQDISFLPHLPGLARVRPGGGYTHLLRLPGPAYSTHAIRSGGYVVGAAREANGDIYPPDEVSAHLFGSADGEVWDEHLSLPRADPTADVRADVYWELPSGELVLELRNVAGVGADGGGFQLLRVGRR
jgi:hypothetical protein